MGKLYFFRTLLLIFGFLISNFSAQIIVDNNSTTPGVETNLQNAINNAAPGSTIYIQPSAQMHSGIYISKNINLVGLASSTGDLKSSVNSIELLEGSSGTTIKGLVIKWGISNSNIQLNTLTENITIKECDVSTIQIGSYLGIGDNYSKSKNWVIQGNNIGGIQSYYNVSKINIQNNIIKYVSFYDVNNVLLNQNIFKSDGSILTETGDILNVSNSIFVGNSDIYGTNLFRIGGRVNIQNSITYDYGSAHTYSFQINPSVDGFVNQFSNMKYNTNPLFLNVNENPKTSDTDFSIANYDNFNILIDDVRLQASSPAKGAGLYGEDLGVYQNYDFGSLKYSSEIPVINSVNSPNSVIMGQPLKMTITAKAR